MSTTIRPTGETRLHVYPKGGHTKLSIEGNYGETTSIRLDAREVAELIEALRATDPTAATAAIVAALDHKGLKDEVFRLLTGREREAVEAALGHEKTSRR